MIEILTGIGQGILTIINLIGNTIASVVWAILNIGKFATTITALFAYCPTFIVVFLEVSLALTILFAVIKLM